MADLHIVRPHALGLAQARAVAIRWAAQAEQEFGMKCHYEEGALADQLHFSRAGVQGSLAVTPSQFELSAKLGFLLGPFVAKIEAEINKNLDQLLALAAASA